jgi:hypothetical protein
MALNKYGVLKGSFDHFEKENPDNFGQYFHGFIFVYAPSYTTGNQVVYKCAVDVKTPSGVIVHYFNPAKLDKNKFHELNLLPDGYHDLTRDPNSGALDYKRNPLISEPLGCATIFWAIYNAMTGKNRQTWKENIGQSALDDLQSFLADIQRIYIFGEPFHNISPDQFGMHDIHLNQGDPIDSQWHNLNAIWQDGGVIIEHPNGDLGGFFIKFSTQTLNTDDNGWPV